jgi:hypothetical protein
MSTTLSKTMSSWETIKPKAIFLVIGLIAGPLITNFAGWQVTSGRAEAQAQAGIVETQASICAAQARTEVADPTKLDYSARAALAKKWAVMPGGGTAVDSAVSNACASKLAS